MEVIRTWNGNIVAVLPDPPEPDYSEEFREKLAVRYVDPSPETTALIARLDRELERTERLHASVVCIVCGRTGIHAHVKGP